jgi:hypothetical protein
MFQDFFHHNLKFWWHKKLRCSFKINRSKKFAKWLNNLTFSLILKKSLFLNPKICIFHWFFDLQTDNLIKNTLNYFFSHSNGFFFTWFQDVSNSIFVFQSKRYRILKIWPKKNTNRPSFNATLKNFNYLISQNLKMQ